MGTKPSCSPPWKRGVGGGIHAPAKWQMFSKDTTARIPPLAPPFQGGEPELNAQEAKSGFSWQRLNGVGPSLLSSRNRGRASHDCFFDSFLNGVIPRGVEMQMFQA